MNKLIRFAVIALVILAFGAIYAKDYASFTGIGMEFGGAYGDNSGDNHSWGPRGRATIQYQLASPIVTQFGLSYSFIKDENTSKTGMADLRFMVNPFPIENIFPYIYAGIGAGKNLNDSDSDFMMMIPMGI